MDAPCYTPRRRTKGFFVCVCVCVCVCVSKIACDDGCIEIALDQAKFTSDPQRGLQKNLMRDTGISLQHARISAPLPQLQKSTLLPLCLLPPHRRLHHKKMLCTCSHSAVDCTI